MGEIDKKCTVMFLLEQFPLERLLRSLELVVIQASSEEIRSQMQEPQPFYEVHKTII